MAKLDLLARAPSLSRRTLLIGGVALAAGGTLATPSRATTPKVSQACVGFSDTAARRTERRRLPAIPRAVVCLDVVGVIADNCSCRIWLPKTA